MSRINEIDPEGFYNKKESAELLNVSASHISTLVQNNKLICKPGISSLSKRAGDVIPGFALIAYAKSPKGKKAIADREAFDRKNIKSLKKNIVRYPDAIINTRPTNTFNDCQDITRNIFNFIRTN